MKAMRARRGEPVGEAQRIVGEPVKRQLHLYEGGGRLHEVAERHFAGEIFRRAEQERDDRRERAGLS